MILTIRADQPQKLLASILESVGGELDVIHQVLNKGNTHEQNRNWHKGKDNFLSLIGLDPSDSALKLNYRIEGNRQLSFEFEHDGGYSNWDFGQLYKVLVVYLLHHHPDEFDEISIVNKNA